MGLEMTTREEGAAVVITPRGRLTVDHGSLLHEQIKKRVAGGARQLVVDLAGVDYIDSHGLGQMVAAQSTVRREGGRLRYAGLTEKVRRLVEMTRLGTILDFDPDVPTGLRKVARPAQSPAPAGGRAGES